MPCGLLDLSSPTRDWTRATAVKAPSPNHWITRELPLMDIFFSSLGLCVRAPQAHPHIQWFTRRTHRNYIHAYGCDLTMAKGYKAKLAKGKNKPGASFQESFPSEVTQDALNFPSSEVWQPMWHIIYRGSLETQCLKHPLPSPNSWLSQVKWVFDISRREKIWQTGKVQWAILISKWWELSGNPSSQIPRGANLVSRPF